MALIRFTKRSLTLPSPPPDPGPPLLKECCCSNWIDDGDQPTVRRANPVNGAKVRIIHQSLLYQFPTVLVLSASILATPAKHSPLLRNLSSLRIATALRQRTET